MKMWGLVLIAIFAFSGCASFQHSEMIDTDQSSGFAAGRYSLNSSGPSGTFVMAGGGGGGGGFGLGAFAVDSRPPQITPYNFARSVAMINYSKRLRSIKYDETGGIIDYEFDSRPMTSYKSDQPGQPRMPSSFGHQPVE